MKCSKNSCIPQFVGDENNNDEDNRNKKCVEWSSLEILNEIVNKELEQLQFNLATEEDDFEKPFIEMAIELCKVRKGVLESECDKSPQNNGYETVNSQVDELKEQIENVGINNKNNYYFYQSSDGQHLYLNQLNMKCMEHQFSSFQNCPHKIQANIVEIESHTMDQETRKKSGRYLRHLPLSSNFAIIEVDLTPYLDQTTLDKFGHALKERGRWRKEKEQKEKKIMKMAQRKHNKKNNVRPANYQLNNNNQFPDIQHSVLFTPNNNSYQSHAQSQPVNCIFKTTSSTFKPCSPSNSNSSTSSTANSWSSLKNRPMTSYKKFQPSVTSQSVSMTSQCPDDPDFDPDYVPPPSFRDSFIQQVWEDPEVLLQRAKQETAANGGQKGGKKGKKKKQKKILLFST